MSRGKGNPKMRRRGPYRAVSHVLAMTLGLGGPAVQITAAQAQAQAQPSVNRLARVHVRETAEATEIIVEGDQKPTFTVFKLNDPPRLFVDLSNADIGTLGAPMDVDNGVINQVAVMQFDDDVVRIGRLVIGLEVDALYSVRAEGSQLIISIDGSQRKSRSPAVAQSGASSPDHAALEAARAQAAEAERRAAEAEQRAAQAQAQAARAGSQSEAAQAQAARAAQTEQRAVEAEQRAAEAERRAAEAEAQAARAGSQSEADRAEALAQAARAAQAEAQAAKAEAQAAQATSQAQQAEQRAAQAEQRAEAALAQAQRETAQAQARAAQAEARASQLGAEAGQAEAKAQAAAEALAQAQSATRAAESRAAEAQAQAQARAKEVEAAEQASQDALALAQARAREAEAARTASREAEAAAQARSRETQAALEAAQVAQAQAQASAQAGREEEVREAQATAQAAQARLEQARGAERSAQESASQAVARAQRAEAEAAERMHAAARAEAELAAAQARVAQAEGRARSAESQAQNAERRATEAEAARREAQRRVEALEAELAQARAQDQSQTAARVAELEAQLEQQRQQQAARTVEAQVAQAATPQGQASAPPAQALPPAASVASRVADVRFDDLARHSQIKVRIQGGQPVWQVRRDGPRTRILELQGASIEPALERSLDTSAFPGPVLLVSTFQAPPPGERVRVVVNLAQESEGELSYQNGELVWRFAKSAQSLPQAQLPPPPPPAYGAPVGGDAAHDPGRQAAAPQAFEPAQAAAYVGLGQVGPTGVPQRAQRVRKRYVGRKINIDIKDGDLHNILRLLAKEGNVNIVTSDEVKGTVTLHLRDVPWDQALDIILRSKGLGQVRDGGIIRVDLQKKLDEEREREVASQKVEKQLKPLQVKLLSVNHANANDLQNTVKGVLSDRGEVQFDKRTNTLIIRDVDDHIEAAVDLVRRLDTQTSQVLLTARIVEVNTNDLKELGIQWGGQALASPATGNATGLRFPGVIGVRGGADDTQAPSGGLPASPNFVVNLPAAAGGGSGGALGMTFGSIDGAFNLNVRLSALENRGSAKVVSQPRIATLDNVKATIRDGVRIPISQVSAAGIQTQFFNADLMLEATPQVTQDGNIYLDMKVTKATPDFQNVGARGDPTILTKEATTQLLLGDGETMVIGGIFSSSTGYSYAEVPYLGRIPILGALFRRYREEVRKSELLIFITTEIMNRRDSSVQTGP